MNNDASISLKLEGGFVLNPILRSDKSAFLEHFSDPEISRNLLGMPRPCTGETVEEWLAHCVPESGSQTTMFAIRAPGGDLIGAIGIDGELASGAACAEFGYWLVPSHRGQGIMPRAIHGFADHIFQHFNIQRLCALPFSTNVSSQRALEKAGFRRERSLRLHHPNPSLSQDAIVYARMREEARDQESETRGAEGAQIRTSADRT